MTPARAAAWLALAALAALGGALAAGEYLTRPARHPVGAPPPALRAESVRFASASGAELHGWLARGARGRGAVLLLHALRGDRRQMAGRAAFLHALGCTLLLVDLQAHGESGGERITFGARESRDAEAALDFLRRAAPGERVAALGVSLGAAALVLAQRPLELQAVVLESLYPTIEEAIANRLRLRFGPAGTLLEPLLGAQLALRLGVRAEELRPIARIGALGAPLLMIAGAEDRHTTPAETARLFAAAREPKELWVVAGAGHVDLHAFSPQEYERRILAFLGRHLGGDSGGRG